MSSDPDTTGDQSRSRSYYRFLFLTAGLVALGVGIHMVEFGRGHHAWSQYLRTRPSPDIPLDWQAYIPPSVPDDQNFALTPFLRPLSDFEPGTQRWRDPEAVERIQKDFGAPYVWDDRSILFDHWLKEGRIEPSEWLRINAGQLDKAVGNAPAIPESSPMTNRAEAARELLARLEPFAPVFAELREASRRPHARFNLRYEQAPLLSMALPHLSVVKKAGLMLEWRAVARLDLGQTEAAFEDLLLLGSLAHSIRDEPVLISHLVRVAAIRAAVQVVSQGLVDRRWSAGQLRRIEAQLAPLELIAECRHALQAERAGGLRMIDQVQHQRALLFHMADDDSSQAWVPGTLARLVPAGWFDLEKRNYAGGFDLLLEKSLAPDARRVDPAGLAEFEQHLDHLGLDNHLMRHRFFLSVLLSPMTKAIQRSAHTQTLVDLARIASALEQHRQDHGAYPGRLDALVPTCLDPLPADRITGQSLEYRKTEPGGFLLYAAGWNGRDDGGQIGLHKNKSPNLDEGDWIWPRPPGQ